MTAINDSNSVIVTVSSVGITVSAFAVQVALDSYNFVSNLGFHFEGIKECYEITLFSVLVSVCLSLRIRLYLSAYPSMSVSLYVYLP
jgi:hypothetical protein